MCYTKRELFYLAAGNFLMTSNREIGNWGEDQAVEFLSGKGYQILERNFYTPHGEIDIICQRPLPAGVQLVFVEVKTRTNTRFGFPEQGVGWRKRQHLLAAIDHYLGSLPELEGFWQVDVIAVRRFPGKGKSPEIIHFENVFV